MTKDITPKELYNLIPSEIRSILIGTGGCLVGGSIRDLINGIKPRDYDIVVPPANWSAAAQFMKFLNPTINTFGGLKGKVMINEECVIVDAWPEEITHLLETCQHLTYVYKIGRNILLKQL